MAKNRSFKNVYQITLTGRCTNGFTAKLIDDLMIAFVTALTQTWPKVGMAFKVTETSGDFDAINHKYKESEEKSDD